MSVKHCKCIYSLEFRYFIFKCFVLNEFKFQPDFMSCRFWISGEPNNAQGNEDCVQIVSSYPLKNSWNDQPCTEERHWICEN